jgi:hypothetical protein
MKEYPKYIEFPRCPCGGRLAIDAYEHDGETGKPTPEGFHFWCENECKYAYDVAIGIEQEIVRKLEL